MLRIVGLSCDAHSAHKDARNLVLIIYDTDGVQKIYERRDMQKVLRLTPGDVIEVKAKYAVCFVEPDDIDLIAQYYATRSGALEAEWTDSWDSIPDAVARLRLRHKSVSLPREIDYVIDWPYSSDSHRSMIEPLNKASKDPAL